MDLFNLKPEKYWDPGAAKSKEEKRKIFEDMVSSNLYMASEKKDGHWHRFVKQDGVAKIQSRGISTITKEYGDHTLHVPHIYNFMNNKIKGDTLLIGEMYIPGKKDRDMTKIFGCAYEKAIKRQEEEKVYFMIFDVWFFEGESFMNTPFEERVYFLLNTVEPLLGDNEYIQFANYFEGSNIYENLNAIFDRGGEGIVLTKKTALPGPGARTARKTLKVKAEIDNDIDVFLTGHFLPSTRLYTGKEIEQWPYWENIKIKNKIMGPMFDSYIDGASIEPVTKNYYMGWPGSLEIGVIKNNNINDIISLGYISGITEELKQNFIANRNRYVMKPCRVSCMEFTDDKKLRHPRFKGFREDINVEDCTYEKIFK